MAHVEKFTAGAMGGLSIHYDRKTDNHSNEDIDVSRSHLNYDLRDSSDGLDTRSRFEKRMKEVYCMKRKDVKPFATWVVTLPEELKEKTDVEQRAFFEKTYKFLTDRYGGEKNVLSANVHNDETTPHLHFAFMPVVWDAKKEREKVSAKEVLNRKDLQTFHQDLDAYLKEQIPHIYEKGILNDKTIGIEDVKQLKVFSDEIKQQRASLEAEKIKINQEREALQKDKKQMNRDFEKVKNMKVKIESGLSVEFEFDDLVRAFEKDWLGRTIVAKKPLRDLKTYVMGVARGAVRDSDKLESAMDSIKYLKNNLIEKNKELEQLINQNANLKNELKEQNEDVFVFKSRLRDVGMDFEVHPREYWARTLLDNVERGIKPPTVKRCREWQETLTYAKNDGFIPENRFKTAFERLKTWLSELLNKERRQEQKRSKSRDMER